MESFKIMRINAGYSLNDCAKVFCVSMKTVYRWEKDIVKPPRAVFICLSLFAGKLDHLGKHWTGFRILPNCIASPDKMHIWPGEIRAMKYLFMAIGISRTEFNMKPVSRIKGGANVRISQTNVKISGDARSRETTPHKIDNTVSS